MLLGGSGGLVAAKFVKCSKSYLRSNLKNTVKYVINTIRRIIRLRRMTHPCYKDLEQLLACRAHPTHEPIVNTILIVLRIY